MMKMIINKINLVMNYVKKKKYINNYQYYHVIFKTIKIHKNNKVIMIQECLKKLKLYKKWEILKYNNSKENQEH